MTTRKTIGFSLELSGSQDISKQLTQVELDLQAVGSELRQVKKDIDTFNNGTAEQRKALTESGKSLKSLSDDYQRLRTQQVQLQEDRKAYNRELRDQVKAYREVENAVPEDSLIGLRRRYRELRKEINLLGKEGRESAEGLAKIATASDIKQEIIDIGKAVNDGREGIGLYTKALEDFFKSVGSNNSAGGALANVLGDILGGGGGPGGGSGGGGVGGIVGRATAALGPYGVAISAVGSSVLALGTFVVDITKQFEELNSVVGNTTELFGLELTNATVLVKTFAETFNKDFNEVLLAANVANREFGEGFDRTIQLLRTGIQAGGDLQGNFLDNIREYSSEAEQAGLSLDQFVEALVRFERAGIFSDRGADIINETQTRITDFTDATRTSFEQAFGTEFTNNLFDQINDGSITAFEGVQRVAQEMQEGNLTAQQYAQVTADLFGGIGEDASTAIEVIAELTGSTEGLVDQTDAYVQRQNAAFDATLRLNQEQQILAAQFAGTTFDLATLTDQAKAFGVSLLNDVLLNVRAIGEEFANGNIGAGLLSLSTIFADFVVPDAIEDFLGIDLGARQETIDDIVEQDAEALRQIKEGEEELAAQRREAAIEGKVGIQELREQQALLQQEIDAARAAGEDYSDLQEELTLVSNNLADATSILNTNIRRTQTRFKEFAAEGSIDQLSERVSKLQSQISKASPNEAKRLIEELTAAELDLSSAREELDSFKESVREANLELLPVEEQVKFIEEGIELRRQLELRAARARVEDEEILQAELAAVNARFDKEISEARLRQYEEDSAEYIELTEQITAATGEIEDLEISIQVQNQESAIREFERVTTTLLQEAFEDEEALQERITLLRLQTDTASIRNRLELENLSVDERFKLEQELATKVEQLREAQARADIDFAQRLNTINREELESTLIPEFDPDDIEGSLEAIRAFEAERTLIQQEAQLERLLLQQELLERQGQDTLEIEAEIAEQRLQLEQERNAALIEETEKRAKAQADFAKKVAEAEKEAFEAIGTSLGKFLISSAEDSEEAFKNLAQGILGTVIDLIAQQATLLVTQAFATPDSVLSFGATGGARVAIISGLIQGASAALKGILTASLSAEGNLLQGGGGLPGGGVFAGKPHSLGGVKFLLNTAFGPQLQEAEVNEAIIKATSTQKWLGLLSAINVDGGGRSFATDTGKYMSILRSIKPTRFATGGQLNGDTSNIPMLVNPSGVQQVTVARISSDDMETLADEVATRFSAAGSEFAESIVDKVITGLDETNRLKERQDRAAANAEV